jgi:hypothetical protein
MNHPSMDTSHMSLDKNRLGKAILSMQIHLQNTLDRDSSHYILVGPQRMARW